MRAPLSCRLEYTHFTPYPSLTPELNSSPDLYLKSFYVICNDGSLFYFVPNEAARLFRPVETLPKDVQKFKIVWKLLRREGAGKVVVYSILAERNSIQDGDKARQGKEMPILKQASLSLSISNMMLILNNLYSQYIIYHLSNRENGGSFLLGQKERL